MTYADLQVTTHFSFLRGASLAEELFARARLLGIKALGIVDRNSLAGIVRAYEAAKTTGVRLIVGCRLDLQCGTSLLVYPTDRAAMGASAGCSRSARRAPAKASAISTGRMSKPGTKGCWRSCCPMIGPASLPGELSRLRRIFGDRAYCALTRRFCPRKRHGCA